MSRTSDSRGTESAPTPGVDGTRSRYAALQAMSFDLASRKAALEAAHDREELADHEEYQRLRSRLADVDPELQATLESLIDDDAVCAFDTIGAE